MKVRLSKSVDHQADVALDLPGSLSSGPEFSHGTLDARPLTGTGTMDKHDKHHKQHHGSTFQQSGRGSRGEVIIGTRAQSHS